MRLPSNPLSDLRLSGLPLPGLRRLPFGQPPSPDDANRRVLVTGGASGLGLALATAFLERGDRVIVADLAPTDARPASVPEDARYLRLDVRSEGEWTAAREQIEKIWGGLDVIRDPYSDAQSGTLRLTALLTADVTVARGSQLAILTGMGTP